MQLPTDLPRPSMTPAVRRVLYAVWSWATVIVVTILGSAAAVGYAIPKPAQVAVLALLTLGGFLGFIARRHVPQED